MATIAVFVVVVVAGVTFVFAQKKNSAAWALFSENMEAVAKGEDDPTHFDTCYMTGSNVSENGEYHCAAGTSPQGSGSGSMYPCAGSIKHSMSSTKGYCVK